MLLCCGAVPKGRWCWVAAPWEYSASQGWAGLAGYLQGKGVLPQGRWKWQVCTTMEADFPWPGRACPGAPGPRNSSRGQAVLGGCSVEVQHFPRAGRASQVAPRQRSASPGQTGLSGLPHNGSRLPIAGQGLLQHFWATELLQGTGSAGQLLHGSVAPSEGRQARPGKAPEVVGFL